MGEKVCLKCGEVKNIECFSKNKSKKFGISSVCKVCHSEYRRNDYLKNKEKILLQVEEYRNNNPEKYNNPNIKAGRTIESKCKNCDNIVFITKRDLKEGKLRSCSKKCRNINNKSVYYYQLKSIKKRAILKNYECDLDEEFLKHLLEEIQGNRCAITSIPIRVKFNTEPKIMYETASLDRIDNDKGYTKDNVHWVLLSINYMKHTLSVESLHKTLSLIKENYKK